MRNGSGNNAGGSWSYGSGNVRIGTGLGPRIGTGIGIGIGTGLGTRIATGTATGLGVRGAFAARRRRGAGFSIGFGIDIER